MSPSQAVDSGIWERTPDALPDANTWPTWGALRERILTSCKKISISHSPALRDGFAAEIFKLSPPELATMSFRGCDNLSKFVLSPITACPSLEDIALEDNTNLTYVLLQSNSLSSLHLHNCPNLEKVGRPLPGPAPPSWPLCSSCLPLLQHQARWPLHAHPWL